MIHYLLRFSLALVELTSFSCQPVRFSRAGIPSLSLASSSVPRTRFKSQVGPQNQVANNRIEGNLGEEWCEREAVGEKEEGEDGLRP